MNYTDADEDSEKLMRFMDEVGTSLPVIPIGILTKHQHQADEAPGPNGQAGKEDDNDWVATHIGRGMRTRCPITPS